MPFPPSNVAGNAPNKPSLTEAKRLVGRWSRGSFDTVAQSIRYHHSRHGQADVWRYLSDADQFDQSSAQLRRLADGAIRWTRRNGEFLITRDDKIVS